MRDLAQQRKYFPNSTPMVTKVLWTNIGCNTFSTWQVTKYSWFVVDFQRPHKRVSWLVFCTPGIRVPLKVEPEKPQERMMGEEEPHAECQELPGLAKRNRVRLDTTWQSETQVRTSVTGRVDSVSSFPPPSKVLLSSVVCSLSWPQMCLLLPHIDYLLRAFIIHKNT